MNSGCTFQRYMHEVLGDIPYIFVYVDDVLVASRTLEEHEDHLREVFNRLRQVRLTMNVEKCVLARPTVEFLGHTISSAGIRPLQEKVDAILQFPPPTSKLDVQRVLGMANFLLLFHSMPCLYHPPLN